MLSAESVLLPPLIRFLGDAFEGFAVFFYVHELALLRAAGRFVALGIVARLTLTKLAERFCGRITLASRTSK